MAKELVPSAAAKAKGVCHTEEECHELYKAIDPDTKAKAIAMLKVEMKETLPIIKNLYDVYGDDWMDHLWDKEIKEYKEAHKNDDLKKVEFVCSIGWNSMQWGMSVRNLLRKKGFGEKELDVHNLDCVFEDFICDAAGIL